DTGTSVIMWGLVITICSLVRLSEIQFGYNLPFDIYLLTVVAIIPQIVLNSKEKKARKVKSYDDVYMDYLWTGFGITIFLLILIVNVFAADLSNLTTDYAALMKGKSGARDFQFIEYVAPLFLMLYGFPTFVTGAAFKFKPMLWGGILCWVCCII